jgi:tetratricopeptide (TPR) repeat protein
MIDRVPELEALAGDARLARALESGNPHRVYRALWWGRLMGKFKEHKELVNSLLANRRLFLKPIKGAPTMYTLNGVGARVYGSDDRDPSDGTYIGTHFITFVFLPIFPLAQYLCTSSGNQYQFFGSVPFGSLVYLWRQLLGVVIALGIAITALTSFESARNNDVTIANGLDYPVEVSIAGNKVMVGPDSYEIERCKVGDHQVVVTGPGGETVEEGELSLRGGPDVVVWNVRGAAYLYEQRIPYTANDSVAVEVPDAEVFCGQQAIVRDRVSFPFREPARSVSLSTGQNVAWRTHFNFIPGGWRACSSHLSHSGKIAEGIALAESQINLDDPEDLNLVQMLISNAQGKAAAIEWIEQRLAEHDGVELHRVRQDLYSCESRYDELRSIYQDYYEQHPGSADASYLLIRTLRRRDALARLREARQRWPDHTYLLRSQAWHLHGNRQFEQSLPLWTALAEHEAGYSDSLAEALVGLGRTEEALALFEAQAPASFDEAVARAHVALLSGKKPEPAALRQAFSDPETARAFFFARVSGELPPGLLNRIKDPVARAAVEITSKLHTDGNAAIELLRQAPEGAEGWLDLVSLLLLLGEAMHANDTGQIERIEATIPGYVYTVAAVRICHGSADQEDFESVPLQYIAAAQLAASQRPGISGRQAQKLRQEARYNDVLSTMVSHALDSWTF